MNASGPGSSVSKFTPKCTTSNSPFQKSTLAVIRSSLKNEGPMFMFKGWLPAWTRLNPTTILIFLILEQLRNAVDYSRSRGYDFV